MADATEKDRDAEQGPDQADGPSGAQLVVAGKGDAEQSSDGDSTQIDEPARLLRIAAMIKSLLNEVRETDLDEAGRERLADVHGRALAGLHDLVSDDLHDELDDVGLTGFGERIPTGSELRVAQAQLAGWLEGLFRGIQASIANQQMAAQAQLAQQAKQAAQGSPGGQYL